MRRPALLVCLLVGLTDCAQYSDPGIPDVLKPMPVPQHYIYIGRPTCTLYAVVVPPYAARLGVKYSFLSPVAAWNDRGSKVPPDLGGDLMPKGVNFLSSRYGSERTNGAIGWNMAWRMPDGESVKTCTW
jgi:hypothetical protein